MSKSSWFTSLSAARGKTKNLIPPPPRYCSLQNLHYSASRNGNSGWCLIAEKLKRYAQNEVDMRLISFSVCFFLNGIKVDSSPDYHLILLLHLLLLLFSDRSSASAINQACNTPRRQSKAKMQYAFLFSCLCLPLSALFALIKFHKLYAKHYLVSPHSEEGERVRWGGVGWALCCSVLILRLRPLLVFCMQLSTPSHKSLLGRLLSLSLSVFKLFLIRATLAESKSMK